MFRQILKNSIVNRFRRYGSSQVVTKQIIPDETSDIGAFAVGDIIHGFRVKYIQVVKDFNITAVSLHHDKTRAEYLHLFRNDNNNLFSINFRTTPMNSTGLPHILEHTVLCGSQLYPIRDPFFKMLNRSLATFMNAMTGSDITFYPFSTQNYSDFRNLQNIYLDAVFRPNLREVDFMQEGWRLENTDPNNINSNLIIKGVVYNEMKGVFSENESILQQKLLNYILPDHTYSYCSGGDPLSIPNLTWEDLKNFHKNHYHPSNAKFFSYGNFPLIPSLEYINAEYLAKFEAEDVKHTEVPPQERWSQPVKESISCRFDNMREPFEQQNTLSVAYLMSDVTSVYETFLVQFLSELLIKGANAPFYKTLIEPNISGGFTPTTGFDSNIRDTIFVLGLQGLKKEQFDTVEKIFDDTIEDVIKNGFDEKHIESIMHSHQLSVKHEGSNFGLSLLYLIVSTWNHGGDVIEQLRFNEMIKRLKKEMKENKNYLQEGVKKYFKDNKHRLVLTMSPDKGYEEKQIKTEEALIKSKTSNLSEEDKNVIYHKCLKLLEEQKKEQDTNLLPTLDIDDINSDVPRLTKEKFKYGPVPTHIFKVNTNELTYFKGILNTSQLSLEQQMMLPLFCYVVTKLGTDKLNYRDFDSMAQQNTSGLSLNVHIGDSLYQSHSYEPGLLLSSYCLDDKVDCMWDLWSQIFNLSALTDVARFEMLLKLYMSNLTHGIIDNGHAYAMLAAQGLVSGTSYQKDLLSGLQHISYMQRLVKTSSFAPILEELSNIAKIVFDKNNFRCALNLQEDKCQPKMLQVFENFVTSLPENTLGTPNSQSYTSTKVWAATDHVNCNHHVFNIPINYCSKAIMTVPYTHDDYAKLQILAKFCTANYLHSELREKNGAYGGGLRLSLDGVLTFFSYRDPRNLQTLDVFDETNKWLEKNLINLKPQLLLEAKLGVFQSVDAPIPPGGKGGQEFIYGLTNDVLQRHRAALMTVTVDGLKEVTEKYLFESPPSTIGKVVLGAKNMDTSKRSDELWTVVDNE